MSPLSGNKHQTDFGGRPPHQDLANIFHHAPRLMRYLLSKQASLSVANAPRRIMLRQVCNPQLFIWPIKCGNGCPLVELCELNPNLTERLPD